MCLAIPARVIELLPDERACVELGGVKKEISLSLLDGVCVGDYVIVHVGFAIGRIDPQEAEQTLATLADMATVSEDESLLTPPLA